MTNHAWSLVLSALIIGMAGCGGGSDGGGTPQATSQTGVFIDSPVSGVAYTCGAFSGATDGNGSFNYEPGSNCTFKIGGITIGSAAAAALITPVTLVSGAVDEANPTVINIVRFLMSLDVDNDSNNGIDVASSAATGLASSTLDFASTNAAFATQAAALVNTAIPGRALVTATQASTHLRSTLLGLLAGNYACSYTTGGVPTGTASIDIEGGVVSGTGIDSAPGSTAFTINGSVTTSGNATLVGGSASTGAHFTGSFSNHGTGSGTWDAGTWVCHKG